MDKQQLDPSIEERARALCEQITVAHNLDAEIQEELYGHVEDKVLGYLRGDVPLSGDDALILVREHFGDPGTVKSLLQDVHATEVTLSQGRRLAAAAIATLCCLLAGRMVLNVVGMCIHYYLARKVAGEETVAAMPFIVEFAGVPALTPILAIPLVLVPMGFAFLGQWAVFFRWKRRLRAGDRPWYYRWSAGRLAAVVCGLLLLISLTPNLPPGWAGISLNFLLLSVGSKLLVIFVMSAGASIFIGQCISWIWWCDAPPRTRRNTRNAACAWFLGLALCSVLPTISVDISATPAGNYYDPAASALSHGRFFDTAEHWTLWWSGLGRRNLFQGAATFVYAGFLGGIAALVYGVAKHFRKGARDHHSDDRLGMS